MKKKNHHGRVKFEELGGLAEEMCSQPESASQTCLLHPLNQIRGLTDDEIRDKSLVSSFRFSSSCPWAYSSCFFRGRISNVLPESRSRRPRTRCQVQFLSPFSRVSDPCKPTYWLRKPRHIKANWLMMTQNTSNSRLS